MEVEKERFKKLFPHLAEEVLQGESKVNIDSYRADPVEGERAVRSFAGYNSTVENEKSQEVTEERRFAGHNPNVIDFIRRCDTREQAFEIIDFMEGHGEISKEYAEQLREKIEKEGVRSLGPKRKSYEEEDTHRPR